MIVASAIFLACGVIGAYYDGAVGTVWGAALATWLGALVWWWQLQLGIRESGKFAARGDRKAAGRHRGSPPSPPPPMAQHRTQPPQQSLQPRRSGAA